MHDLTKSEGEEKTAIDSMISQFFKIHTKCNYGVSCNRDCPNLQENLHNWI